MQIYNINIIYYTRSQFLEFYSRFSFSETTSVQNRMLSVDLALTIGERKGKNSENVDYLYHFSKILFSSCSAESRLFHPLFISITLSLSFFLSLSFILSPTTDNISFHKTTLIYIYYIQHNMPKLFWTSMHFQLTCSLLIYNIYIKYSLTL